MPAFMSSPLDLAEHERLQIEAEQELLLQAVNAPAGIADLLQVLQKSEKTLRLAVISGCQTARTQHMAGFRDLTRALAQRRIPAVIAMQFSITDTAGLLFAENLYPRLIDGQRLSAAMSACRRALLYHDDAHIKTDAFAPVLLLANDECLKTEATDRSLRVTGQSHPQIDFSFHLPLPQLSFSSPAVIYLTSTPNAWARFRKSRCTISAGPRPWA